MNISLLQVLNAPLFKNIKILSGKTGLDRIVKRASVFDAPFKEDVLEKDILAPGDFFITSLLQFRPGSEELMRVLELLVKGNCSGLCVMMEERAELFSEEMLVFCEEKRFPVICMREDISYAEVLGVINQYIPSPILTRVLHLHSISVRTVWLRRLQSFMTAPMYILPVFTRSSQKKLRISRLK